MSNEDMKEVLSEVVSQQKELKAEFHKKKKDTWDKVAIASSFISGVVLAVVGIYFTHSYNQQQAEVNKQQADYNRQQVERDNALKTHQMALAEIQTVGTFLPFLSGEDENKKRAAILAIKSITDTKLAGEIAAIYKGEGAVQAMTAIARSGNQSDKAVANETLATIASVGSKPEERKAAVDGLRMIGNNPVSLQAPDKSPIKVQVTSEGTSEVISYSLNGIEGTGNSLAFTLDKASHNPAILTMIFLFTNSDGGVYTVTVTGSNGVSSVYAVRQKPGGTSASVSYTFEIV